jgi:membrane protein
MPVKSIIAFVKDVYAEFSKDDVMTQAAALAFYTGLSLAPMLTVAVWVARNVFGEEAKEKIADAFAQVIGSQAAGPIKDLLDPAAKQAETGMTVAGLISLAIVFFSATGVFGQLQSALNVIWSVQAKPGEGGASGIWMYVRKRFLSFGMLLSILFLLLTSLVISTAIQGFLGTGGDGAGWLMQGVSLAVSFALFAGLFALLFKYVPDAKLDWKSVGVGATVAAALFLIGKFALGIYLGRGSYENSYGAAIGSFVALLVWVYYSAIILLAGAEVAQVYGSRTGHPIEPEPHAQKVQRTTQRVSG